METVLVDVAGFIDQGKPLIPAELVVTLPADLIEPDTEVVYRFLTACGEILAGTYAIAELRTCAHSGELIVAREDEAIYVGRWWAKHGVAELRDNAGNTLLSNPVILASINYIILYEERR
jgi:hypothetical protein